MEIGAARRMDRALYLVERQALELPAAERLQLRQGSSAPVLAVSAT
jgi:hypothetical protein